MSTSIQTNFNISAAKAFIDDFSSSKNSYYLMISKPSEWPNENTPPLACDNTKDKVLAWTESIAAKKMTSKNIRLVVKRCDWTNGQVYSRYDDTEEIFKSSTYTTNPFYVLTSDFRVYKCIAAGPAGSTVEPSHTNTHLQTPNADGYVWQFMYQLSEEDFDFLTDDFMPVSVAGSTEKIGTIEYLQREAQENARPGGISHIELNQGGAPWYDAWLYDRDVNESFFFSHDVNNVFGSTFPDPAFPDTLVRPDGSSAEIETTVIKIGDSILNPTIRQATDDYYKGWALRGKQTVDISKPFKSFYEPILEYKNNNSIVTFTVKDLGDTADLLTTAVEIVPYVSVDGDTGPAGESGTVVVEPVFGSLEEGTDLNGLSADTQIITSLKITDPGRGVFNPTVNIFPPPGNSASGAGFSASAIVSPMSGHGSNAPRELGANKVMIRMLLKGNEGGAFDVVNDYRIFSILKNPQFSGFSAGIPVGTRAGSLDDQRKLIEIKNPNNIATVNFSNTDETAGVTFGSSDFTIGENVCQGTFNTNQPRGVVVGWTGSFALGRLSIDVKNGTFKSTAVGEEPIGVTSGKITKGETTGVVYTGGSAGHIGTVTTSNSFNAQSFKLNDLVVGLDSRSTGKVTGYLTDSFGETAKVTVQGVVGDFISPKVSLGTLVDGEKIFRLRDISNANGTVITSADGVGTISKISDIPYVEDETHRLTDKIRTFFSGADFIITGSELDNAITGSTSGASAIVVNGKYATGTTGGGADGSTVDIFVTKVMKSFRTGEQINFGGFTGTIREKEPSEFLPYTGEVLYIENVRPVQRSADQEEEIKLVIDF